MARPRSEEKRLALLRVAAAVVARHGLAAPTAQVAKGAGVAEGTLFRYFPTKEILLNELTLHLLEKSSKALAAGYDTTAPLQARARGIWDRYIDWGLANQEESSALNQLMASEVLTVDTQEKADVMFPDATIMNEMMGKTVFGDDQVFSDALFVAVANATLDFATRFPDRAAEYKDKGFVAVWRLWSD